MELGSGGDSAATRSVTVFKTFSSVLPSLVRAVVALGGRTIADHCTQFVRPSGAKAAGSASSSP